jgi:predicted amidohydrolase
MRSVTIAAMQAASVLMDREATLAKAVELIAKAAAGGSRIVVFPEVFITSTPVWVYNQADLGARRRVVRDARRPGCHRAGPGH